MGKQILIKELGLYLPDRLKEDLDILLDDVIHSDMDLVLVLDGKEGCITGDTEIQVSRCKFSRRFTIERMYNAYNDNVLKLHKYKKWDLNIPSYIRAYNGKEIRLHKVKDVVCSGEKQVFLLNLINGKSIKATEDHKIMTKKGFIELKDLSTRSLVMCDTLGVLPEYSKVSKITKLGIERTYDIQCEEPYHNFVANGIVIHNSGKSYDARLLGKYFSHVLGTPFGVENIHFNAQSYIKFSESKPKYTVNIFDESREALNKKRGMSKSNVNFTNYLSENRDKQQVHIILLPAIHDLDSYIAIWRMRLLIHKILGHVKDETRRGGYRMVRGNLKVYENTKYLQQVMFNKVRYGYYAYPKEYKYARKIKFVPVFTTKERKSYMEKKATERRKKYDGTNKASKQQEIDDKFNFNLNTRQNLSQDCIAEMKGISRTMVGESIRRHKMRVAGT